MTDKPKFDNSNLRELFPVFGHEIPDAIYTTYEIAKKAGVDLSRIPEGSGVCITRDGVFEVKDGE